MYSSKQVISFIQLLYCIKQTISGIFKFFSFLLLFAKLSKILRKQQKIESQVSVLWKLQKFLESERILPDLFSQFFRCLCGKQTQSGSWSGEKFQLFRCFRSRRVCSRRFTTTILQFKVRDKMLHSMQQRFLPQLHCFTACFLTE